MSDLSATPTNAPPTTNPPIHPPSADPLASVTGITTTTPPPPPPPLASGLAPAIQLPIRPGLRQSKDDDDGRRASIQFAAHPPASGLPTGSPKSSRLNRRRRMSSPPPPQTFQSRVSFDTFDNKDASDFSLTLNCKHNDYQYTRRSRTFLCGTDQNDYSEFALEWLIEELVDDGDEIVCLRVVDKDAKISSDASVAEGVYRTEAHKMLDHIISKNTDGKAISLVLEFAVGKVQDTFQQMIRIYEPAILIVGTRGRSLGGLQGLLPGSVSKYCLQYSPVPVIVVRPTAKREKKKKKRQADPSRKGYLDMLLKSEVGPGHLLDASSRRSLSEGGVLAAAPELEAEAVAQAVGLPPQYHHLPPQSPPPEHASSTPAAAALLRAGVSEADDDDDDERPGPVVLMTSPGRGRGTSDGAMSSEPEAEAARDDEEADVTEGGERWRRPHPAPAPAPGRLTADVGSVGAGAASTTPARPTTIAAPATAPATSPPAPTTQGPVRSLLDIL
ncbi:MAG: hypothetical protein M1826_006761 [Phylliscum demangeonii]|nr:MAG: hypothetical protein M1826_006761 [Phylliscum demangeonii]